MIDERIFKIIITSILIFLILNLLDNIITNIKYEKFENEFAKIDYQNNIINYKTPDLLNQEKLNYKIDKSFEKKSIDNFDNNNLFLTTNYEGNDYFLINTNTKDCDNDEKDCSVLSYILVDKEDFIPYLNNLILEKNTKNLECVKQTADFCKPLLELNDEPRLEKCLLTNLNKCKIPRSLNTDFELKKNTEDYVKTMNMGDIHTIFNNYNDSKISMNLSNNNICGDGSHLNSVNNMVILKSADNISFKIGLIDYTDKYNSTKYIGICKNKTCKLLNKNYKRICLYESPDDTDVLIFNAFSI